MNPPDIAGDLMESRFVIATHRQWMEPYYRLEQAEEGSRAATRSWHPKGLELWLRCVALFDNAFSRRYVWEQEPDEAVAQATYLRMDLLGLAGSTSKPALDALIAGYYSPAYGMIRSLLETWRRVVFARLSPAEALPYFTLPNESPIGDDGWPHPHRNRGVTAKEIKRVIKEKGTHDDYEYLRMITAGITHMHGGAHPSAEGMEQLKDDDHPERRTFGPTYRRSLCVFGLKWGVTAHLYLLEELTFLLNFEQPWMSVFLETKERYSEWLDSAEARFDAPKF